MDKLEKVIKGLGSCVEYFANKVKGVMFDEWLEESRKAIALLKAQEPKVETWEEAQANVQDGPFIIFEVRDSTGSEVDFGVLVGDFYEMSEKSVLTVADFGRMKDDYGKRFRLWTSRPDEKRRAETPWER